jgi:hypothetical protein
MNGNERMKFKVKFKGGKEKGEKSEREKRWMPAPNTLPPLDWSESRPPPVVADYSPIMGGNEE